MENASILFFQRYHATKQALNSIPGIRVHHIKGACSEIFGKLIFFKPADMVTLPIPKHHPYGEKIANMYFICKQFEKTMFMLLIVL